METVKCNDLFYEGNFMYWLLCNSISVSDEQVLELVNESLKKDSFEVKLTINGLEVDCTETLKRMKDNFDHEVKKEAESILFDKIGNIMQNLQNMKDNTKDILKQHNIDCYGCGDED